MNTSGCFVYNTPLPIAHVARFRGKANANQQTQFISPELRIELLQRQLAFETKVDPTAYTDIPSAVEHYSNLVPLENVAIQNQPQTTFKAFSCRDGGFYCLRRIHGYAVTHPGKQTFPAEQWKKLAHVNIVPLRELLINCRAFGDSSLVFVYDYYPLAVTLMSKHFEPKSATFYDAANGFRLSSTVHMPPPLGTAASENMLWSYLIQITAALRAIHTNGLACRAVDLNKIIVYGNKIMLSFCGIQDIVNQDQQAIQTLQFEDLNQLGNLMVALASGRSHGYRKDLLQGTMKTIMETYSIDFKAVVT
uniref:Protein kinase domain-containing protein n=1 Tax=Caenorhabditis japonica TaxID=281687 RepID=A0A8R1DE59_CAEJA